ncbi:hypothetical protein HYR99_15020 [Candidatus Poribacteria bacterium]|nr:hypothetical protein [Candidatus Poribacteria bacterium]
MIIYQTPDKQGNPIYVFSNMRVWNAAKRLGVRLHRWDVEPFHELIKQFLGAESRQLQTEVGVHIASDAGVCGELAQKVRGYVRSDRGGVNGMVNRRVCNLWSAMSPDSLLSLLGCG